MEARWRHGQALRGREVEVREPGRAPAQGRVVAVKPGGATTPVRVEVRFGDGYVWSFPVELIFAGGRDEG